MMKTTTRRRKPKTAITTTHPAPLVTPAAPLGTEHITSDDVMMPRLGLAQAISNEVNKTHADFIDDLGVGDFFNTVSNRVYGSGPLIFSILVAHPPRAVEFAALSDGGGIIDPNVPLNDPRMNFGDDGTPPQATKFYDYVLWLHESDELIAMSLARSAIKAAKSLNGLIRMRGTAVFTGRYTVTSVQKTSSQGNYQSWRFRNSTLGNIPETQAQEFAKLHSGLKLAIPTPVVIDPE
jgi:hypothetical protein